MSQSIIDILYVEDNEDNIFVLEMRFSVRSNVNLRIARTGSQARSAWQDKKPDLILMDIGLPDTSGVALIKELKSGSGTETIPVIALTAFAMDNDRLRCLEAGCDDFDTKPIDFERLVSKITTCLGLDKL